MKKFIPSPLTDTQREIMEVIWSRGEATVKDVHEVLSANRNVSRNTVQTMIVRLEKRVWLKYTDTGKGFLYSAAKPKQVSLGAKVAQMMDRFFNGKPEELVTALMEYRGLSSEEGQRIREMIENAESDNKTEIKPLNRRKGQGRQQ